MINFDKPLGVRDGGDTDRINPPCTHKDFAQTQYFQPDPGYLSLLEPPGEEILSLPTNLPYPEGLIVLPKKKSFGKAIENLLHKTMPQILPQYRRQ